MTSGSGAQSDLPARLAVAGIGIPLALGLIYLGGWPLGILVAVFAGVGAHEFYALASAAGAAPFGALGVTGAVFMVLGAAFSPTLSGWAVLTVGAVVVLTLGGLALSIWRRWPGGKPLVSISATVAGAIYTGGALGFALLLRHLPGSDGTPATALHGAALLAFPLLVTWVGDSCAYFAGRAWGVRKLIPRVSPGKTVVGGVAGLAGAVAAGALYGAFVLNAGSPWSGLNAASLALMGLGLGVAAQVGDLGESVLKREAGVKDSGRLLPGHGGALDRLDALLFTIPLAYAMVRLAGAAT